MNCANTLNHLSSIEYGENGLQFGRVHNKMTNIWAEINSLQEGETLCDLADYSSVSTNVMIIEALKEGLVEAQRMLNCLNMAPSVQASRDKKIWFKTPWEVEKNDPKHMAFIPGAPVYGDDGDGEVLREQTLTPVEDEAFEDTGACDLHVEAELPEDDVDPIIVAEMETRDVLAEMLSTHENQIVSKVAPPKVIPVVEYRGHQIFKATLVSQLNANPFLSKDRLTRVRNSVYFNNSDDYLSAASSSSTCLLGLGSDCGVYFVQRSSTTVSSTVKAAARRHSQSRNGQCGVPSSCLEGVDKGSWWVGRVQRLRRKVGASWRGVSQPVDLLTRFNNTGKKSISNPIIEVQMNWFSKAPGRHKFKYDHSDPKWVDIDTVITTVTLSYQKIGKLYTLNPEDVAALDDFVSKNAQK